MGRHVGSARTSAARPAPGSRARPVAAARRAAIARRDASVAPFLADAGVGELVRQLAAFEPGGDAGFLVGVATEHVVPRAWRQDLVGQLVLAWAEQLDVVTVVGPVDRKSVG